jgi:hypothetical protein
MTWPGEPPRDGSHDFDFEFGTRATSLRRRTADDGATWESNWLALDTRMEPNG